MEETTNTFIKYHSVYHKIIYAMFMALMTLVRLMRVSDKTVLCFSIVGVVFVFAFLDGVFYHLNKYEENFKIFTVFRFIEFSVYMVFMSLMPFEPTLYVGVFLLLSLNLSEFIIMGTNFDSTSIFLRRIVILIPVFFGLVLTLKFRTEGEWFRYVICMVILFCVVYYVVDWVRYISELYESQHTNNLMELNKVREQNEMLVVYQEKVKSINEKVNYQKIELAKTINDLEQINKEVESQKDVMRYMASSFDISKNVNVIINAIMDIKQPKLCAIYMDDSINLEHVENFYLQTDYSTIERKLKREIVSIYKDLKKSGKRSDIYVGEGVKCFRFVNDTNLQSLAVMIMLDDDVPYGLMMIGSDKQEFFENGVSYYETCIVEFNISVKSTQLYLQTQDMARKDGLTGIYNRVYFTELFNKAAKHAREENFPIVVALFDIDKFKTVNDTYGHLVGDMVIKMVAGIDEKYAKRYNGFACRFGGEEFLLVLPGHTDKTALPILEAMHEEIKNTEIVYNDKSLHVNVCIGLSAYPNLCENTDILVNRADKAMYYGKKHGRGRLVVDNPAVDNVIE